MSGSDPVVYLIGAGFALLGALFGAAALSISSILQRKQERHVALYAIKIEVYRKTALAMRDVNSLRLATVAVASELQEQSKALKQLLTVDKESQEQVLDDAQARLSELQETFQNARKGRFAIESDADAVNIDVPTRMQQIAAPINLLAGENVQRELTKAMQRIVRGEDLGTDGLDDYYDAVRSELGITGRVLRK